MQSYANLIMYLHGTITIDIDLCKKLSELSNLNLDFL